MRNLKGRKIGWTEIFALTRGEFWGWMISATLITLSFVCFDRSSWLTLAASLIGVTSLVYNAKGNFVGPLLMILFSLFYGYISYDLCYFGEMVTYLGMTLPMSLLSLVSWLKNPSEKRGTEVRAAELKRRDVGWMLLWTPLVTALLGGLLIYFGTARITLSILSVSTSFLASYLTFKRSPFYALGYAVNDLVLIALWTPAAVDNSAYWSVVSCFVFFLGWDLCGFIRWKRMLKAQNQQALK